MIHPSAIVETTSIGADVEVREFSIIRKGVEIGNNVIIHPHVIIEEGVTIGDDVEIFPGTYIGKPPTGARAASAKISHHQVFIGSGCTIGPNAVIYKNVIINDNTTISGSCQIGYPSPLASGEPLIIGENSHIRSQSVFYEGSKFGENLVTGHRVTVRENTIAGIYFQIGTLADIQGDCEIGDYVRTQSYVFVGKEAKIGNFVWLFPHVVLTNDPHPPSDLLIGVEIKDYAVVATMAVILPGITINEHALVGAHSLVNRDVPEGMVVGGVPAKVICETSEIKHRELNESAYPWPRHFHRGYPEDIVKEWKDRYSK